MIEGLLLALAVYLACGLVVTLTIAQKRHGSLRETFAAWRAIVIRHIEQFRDQELREGREFSFYEDHPTFAIALGMSVFMAALFATGLTCWPVHLAR